MSCTRRRLSLAQRAPGQVELNTGLGTEMLKIALADTP
jgi:hypothetical protein